MGGVKKKGSYEKDFILLSVNNHEEDFAGFEIEGFFLLSNDQEELSRCECFFFFILFDFS
jgi:hypothetical protein